MARTSTSTKKKAATKKAVASTKKAVAKKKKTADKKAAGKKASVKKTVSKKQATSKKKRIATTATKKRTVAKKSATAKTAAKKTVAKKTVAKKTAAKKSATAKTAAKKTAVKKTAVKKTVAKKTAVKVPAFLSDKKWLQKQKAELIGERATYTHNAESLAADAAALMADRDPGDVQFDEESGEGDTLAVERDRDLALSAKAREKVDEIDAALIRLEKGKYGCCVSGEIGDFIPKERLEALPMAAKCVKHQTAMF